MPAKKTTRARSGLGVLMDTAGLGFLQTKASSNTASKHKNPSTSTKGKIEMAKYEGRDRPFCEKWSKRLEIPMTIRDCGTYVFVHFGDGAAKKLSISKELAEEIYADAALLASSAGQDVGRAADLLGEIARGVPSNSPEWRVVRALKEHLEARFSGWGISVLASKGSIGEAWEEEG